MRKSYILAGLMVLANCFWNSGCTSPQTAKAELPSGESVMDKHVEATGGLEAHRRIKNSAAKGVLEVASMGLRGSFVLYGAEPNLLYLERELPRMGKYFEGCDGKVVWSYDARQGPFIIRGKDMEEALLQAQFNEADWRAKYIKAETKSIDKVEGEECYRVIVTTKAGNSETHHYSKQTGLLVKTVFVQATADMGRISIESVNKDYKRVGGILAPHQIIQKVQGMTVVMTFSEIKKNTDLPQSAFNPPAQVRALLN